MYLPARNSGVTRKYNNSHPGSVTGCQGKNLSSTRTVITAEASKYSSKNDVLDIRVILNIRALFNPEPKDAVVHDKNNELLLFQKQR
jgi:hypothetical protein